MKILLDEGVPQRLRGGLSGHAVDTVQSLGLGGCSDAEVLRRAEADGYDLFVTTDKNLKHQQNLRSLRIKTYELPSTSWPKLRVQLVKIRSDIAALFSGRDDLDLVDVDE